jgi:hypothetical protein
MRSTNPIAIAFAMLAAGLAPPVGADEALPESTIVENPTSTQAGLTRQEGTVVTIDGRPATVFEYRGTGPNGSAVSRFTTEGLVPCGLFEPGVEGVDLNRHIRFEVHINCGPPAPSLAQETVLIASPEYHYVRYPYYTTDVVWNIQLNGDWQGNLVIQSEASDGTASVVYPIASNPDPDYGYGLMFVHVWTDYRTDFRLTLSLTGTAGAPPIASFSRSFQARSIPGPAIAVADWSVDAQGSPNYFSVVGAHDKPAGSKLVTEFAGGGARELKNPAPDEILDAFAISAAPVNSTIHVLGNYHLSATRAFDVPQPTYHHRWTAG